MMNQMVQHSHSPLMVFSVSSQRDKRVLLQRDVAQE